VILAPGERSRVVTVNVAGDTEVEPDGWFSVALSAPQAGVALAGGAAVGVVRNDDRPATGTLGISATPPPTSLAPSARSRAKARP
jgi:hypothetical protein